MQPRAHAVWLPACLAHTPPFQDRSILCTFYRRIFGGSIGVNAVAAALTGLAILLITGGCFSVFAGVPACFVALWWRCTTMEAAPTGLAILLITGGC